MSLQDWPVTLVNLRSSCILSGRLPGKLHIQLLPTCIAGCLRRRHKTTDVVDFVQCAFGESSLWIRHSFLSV